MSKIDKFLYGGFAVIAIASIVAMLVSVFSLPKQIVEEIIETKPKFEPQTLEREVADNPMPRKTSIPQPRR